MSPSTVGTSTTTYATSYPFQHKSFYANGRFWVFYSDGTNMVYCTSTDGSTWTEATTVGAATNGRTFSVWFDGTYMHYAYCFDSGSGLYYRRGTPNADGTITWSADEQTVLSPVAGRYRSYPYVSTDSNGYVWIGYLDDEGIATYWFPYVIKSGNNDGTWGTTPPGFPYKLSTTDKSWSVSVIPLTVGKMLVIYTYTTGTVTVIAWDGTAWLTEVATASACYCGYQHCAVAQGDDVHLTFLKLTGYDILYTKYSYSSNSFSAETTLVAGATLSSAPVLSIDTATNDLYVFATTEIGGVPSGWTANHIYYIKYTASSGTWGSWTDWIDETTEVLYAADGLTCFYQAYDNYMGLVYMTKTASPYNVKFDYLSIGLVIVSNLIGLIYKSVGIIANLFRLVSSIFQKITSSLSNLHSLRISLSKLLSKVYSTKVLVSKLISIIHSLRAIVSRIFKSIYNLKILIKSTFKSIYGIKSLISKYISGLYSSLSRIIKLFSLRFNLIGKIVKTFTLIYNLSLKVLKIFVSKYSSIGRLFKTFSSIFFLRTLQSRMLSSSYLLRTLISKISMSLYKIIERLSTTLRTKFNIKGLIGILLKGVYSLRTFISSRIRNIYSLREFFSKALISLYSLRNLVSNFSRLEFKIKGLISILLTLKHSISVSIARTLISLSSILKKVPRISCIKYSTKISISRILSSKFGIGAIISRILSFIYSFIGFNIISVTANPSKVIRTGTETTQLRCDWHDESDLDASLYECKFWVRDEMNNIYGPYIGTVVKDASKEYYATYDLDPSETFLLGYYDIRVEVTKYG
jgi:hypothetical protein